MNFYNFFIIQKEWLMSIWVAGKAPALGYFIYRKWLKLLKDIERKIVIKKNGGRFYCPKCGHNYPFLLRWGNPSAANLKFRVIGAYPR